MKKYSLWNNQDEMIFSCNDNTIFSTTIEVNYPLCDFDPRPRYQCYYDHQKLYQP